MVEIGDILYYGIGAAGSIFITTEEISLAESQSGIDFETAKPTAGTPFIQFSKWFFPIETGKLLGLYFAQDYIEQDTLAKFIHGLMFGNVGMDLIYWLKPSLYKTIVNTFSGLIGKTEAAV